MYVFLVIALVFAGCGGSDHDSRLTDAVVSGVPNGTWTKSKDRQHPLAGIWRSECFGFTTELRVFDKHSLIVFSYFEDRDCQRPSFQSVWVMSDLPKRISPKNQMTKDRTWITEVSADTGTLKDVRMVFRSDAQVNHARKIGYCGIKEWSKNLAVSIMDTDCVDRKTGLGRFIFKQTADQKSLMLIRDGSSDLELKILDQTSL